MFFFLYCRFLFGSQVFRCIEYLIDTSCRSTRSGIHDKDTGNRKHSVQNDGKVRQKSNDGTWLCLSCVDTEGTDNNNQSQTNVQKQVHHRVCDTHSHRCFCFATNDITVYLRKMFLFLFCLGKCLNYADTADIFTYSTHHDINSALQIGIHWNTFARYQPDNQCNKRQYRDHGPGQYRFQCHGNGNSTDQQNRRADSQTLHHTNDLVDVVAVGGKSCFQRWNREVVDLRAGKVRNLFEKVMAQCAGSVSCNRCGNAVCKDIADQRCNGAEHHQQTPEQNQPGIFLRNDIVQNIGQNPWNHQLHNGSYNLK